MSVSPGRTREMCESASNTVLSGKFKKRKKLEEWIQMVHMTQGFLAATILAWLFAFSLQPLRGEKQVKLAHATGSVLQLAHGVLRTAGQTGKADPQEEHFLHY